MKTPKSPDTFVIPICDRCKRLAREYQQYLQTVALLGKKPSKRFHEPELRRVDVRLGYDAVSMDGKRFHHYEKDASCYLCLPCSEIMTAVFGGTKDIPSHLEQNYTGPKIPDRHVTRVRVEPAKNRHNREEMLEYINTSEWWDRHKEEWIPYHPAPVKAESEREADEARSYSKEIPVEDFHVSTEAPACQQDA